MTLPLILARVSIPGSGRSTCGGSTQDGAEAICDRIAATGALDEVRERASDGIERAKGVLDSPDFTAEERQLLDLIADGVVERYS